MADGGSHGQGLELMQKCSKHDAEKVSILCKSEGSYVGLFLFVN